ncbi:hypothetical protein GCM10009621_13480 [Corynebacterium felinum]
MAQPQHPPHLNSFAGQRPNCGCGCGPSCQNVVDDEDMTSWFLGTCDGSGEVGCAFGSAQADGFCCVFIQVQTGHNAVAGFLAYARDDVASTSSCCAASGGCGDEGDVFVYPASCLKVTDCGVKHGTKMRCHIGSAAFFEVNNGAPAWSA